MSWNNTVTCSYCHNQGHNRRGCEQLKEYVRDNPDSWQASRARRSEKSATTRKCSYCKESGHNRKTCTGLKRDIINAVDINAEWRRRVRDYLSTAGFGIGALVKYKEGWDETERVGLVKSMRWDDANFLAADDGNKGAFIHVVPLESFGQRGKGSILRPPTNCEGFDTEKYGHRRVSEIVSPVTARAVENQIPSSWLNGASGVGAMFENERADGYHNSSQHPSARAKALAEDYGIQLKADENN
jgi:hypothetical protein